MFGPMSKEEFEEMREYIYQRANSGESSENAITYFMEYHIIPYKPIIDDMKIFKRNGIDVHFTYGDDDWLDTDFSETKVSEELLEEGYNVDIITNSKHNIFMFNYQELILRLN
eukprot:CAMPEP_0197013622 /NCGR_PEP_ID=MMETSP1380-20130617/66953_1 /TAXON_ID=5936 /ORGANISM="Euplotes crassus, Strain CT5" /LENGTH=112 /DNA_ID=CAMNT_0042438009 /DNA_START=972 /DNA_END=1307 /DNA_ORIENTATION=+